MREKLLSATDLRLKILESLCKLWEMRPGPRQFFTLKEVWKEIYKEVGSRVDNHLSEGTLESLQDERLIEIKVDPRDKISLVRITQAGRLYFDRYQESIQRRKKSESKKQLKAFISYSSKDKIVGAKVKDVLSNFSIEGFLAHDDINVSEEWKKRIREELDKSDIFVPLLSKNFKDSDWAPQEAGIACVGDILIIPLRLDETIPFGFIDHLQGKPITEKDIPLNHLIKPIIDKFPEYMIAKVVKKLEEVRSFRYAERVMELLIPYFNNFEEKNIDMFMDVAITNGQIWSADLCRTEYLPKFIKINRNKIESKKLEVLSYQIENNEWYGKAATAKK